MYRSVTDIRFYDVECKKYNKRVSFSSSKRSDFSKDNGVPGPTRYNAGTVSDKKLPVQFKAGREVNYIRKFRNVRLIRFSKTIAILAQETTTLRMKQNIRQSTTHWRRKSKSKSH